MPKLSGTNGPIAFQVKLIIRFSAVRICKDISQKGGYGVGVHPFPSRTGTLSPTAPMVLASSRESRSPPNIITHTQQKAQFNEIELGFFFAFTLIQENKREIGKNTKEAHVKNMSLSEA